MRKAFGWILSLVFAPFLFLWRVLRLTQSKPKVPPDREVEEWYKSRAKKQKNNGVRDIVEILADLTPVGEDLRPESTPALTSTYTYQLPSHDLREQYEKARGILKVNVNNWSQDPTNPKRKIRNNWIWRWMRPKCDKKPINLKDSTT